MKFLFIELEELLRSKNMIIGILTITCLIITIIINVYYHGYEKGWREHEEFIDSFFDIKINDEKLKVIMGDAENENEE